MAGPFVERFRAIVEPLFGRPFTAADGIPETELDAIAGRCGYELPETLHDFYAVVGRFEPVLSPHNRFYPPGDLTRMDGRLVFCEENQVVVYWGYDEDQGWRTDPPVYQGVNNDEIEWYVEADRASYFLAGMIFWQALYGGLPHLRFGDAPESVRQAAAAWPLVWQDESTRVYSRGPVVFSLTGQDGSVEVQRPGCTSPSWRSCGGRSGCEQDRPNQPLHLTGRAVTVSPSCRFCGPPRR
jgi:hypothetical protein